MDPDEGLPCGRKEAFPWCRFVPTAMVQSAIGGFALLIVAAMGTWAVYGEFRCPRVACLMSDVRTTDVTRNHD